MTSFYVTEHKTFAVIDLRGYSLALIEATSAEDALDIIHSWYLRGEKEHGVAPKPRHTLKAIEYKEAA